MEPFKIALFEVLLIAILVSIAIAIPLEKLSCRDPTNKPVDWFVITKLPKNAEQNSGLLLENDGLLHAYITSDNPTWSVPSSIRGPSTVLSMTLGQHTDTAVKYLAYNDNESETQQNDFDFISNSSILLYNAHAKGFIWINEDGSSGFWSSHSIPRYQPIPTESNSWVFPENAKTYGQILFCVSFEGTENKNKILRHIRFMNSIVPTEKNNFSYDEYGKLPVGDEGQYLENKITSTAGQNFVLLSKAHPRKNPHYYEDIFEHYRTLDQLEAVAMRVLTWGPNINGNYSGVLPNTYCGGTSTGNPITTNDVQRILFSTSEGYAFRWGACSSNSNPGILRQDHSKWAVMNSDTFCVADMNRIESQTRRSGGLVCFKNSILSQAFLTMIDT